MAGSMKSGWASTVRTRVAGSSRLYPADCRHSDIFAEVTRGTRKNPEASPMPRALLFEGPPGCGKTMMARVIGEHRGQ